MQDCHSKERRWVSVKDRLPKPGQFVRYRTNEFSAAGTFENGKWIAAKGQPEPAEVLEWLEQ